MSIVAGTIEINPQNRQATLDAIKRMMQESQAEDGCITYEFSNDLTAPNTLHLFEVWESAEALQTHRETPHMAFFSKEVMPTFVRTHIKRFGAEVMR